MSLISGKEALIALANGEVVLDFKNDKWVNVDEFEIRYLLNCIDVCRFRLKPRTITINGIELNRCYALGIDRIKNEVSIQFKDESDAEILHDLLAKLYGFKG